MVTFSRDLQRITTQEYPRFSDSELLRRRSVFGQKMAERGVSFALIRGFLRIGPAIPYFTGWHTTHDAVLLMMLDEEPVLFVNHYNHLPMAQLIARLTDVRWGGISALGSALGELKKRGGASSKIGIIGNFTVSQHNQLNAYTSSLIDMSEDFTQMRLIKSEEEHSWMKIGAILSDAGIGAIPEGLQIGMSEYQL